MYERILIPTDGSEVAEAAIEQAVDIAEKYGAELHALYVIDTDAVSYSLGSEQVDRLQQGKFDEVTELKEKAAAATESVRTQAKPHGIDVIEHHAGGRPHRLIADYADEHDIDLIVMGSHGRSGVRRALLGSVTERTLRSTHTPVLVVDYGSDESDHGE